MDRERERDREFLDREFGERKLRDRELRDRDLSDRGLRERDLRDRVDEGASFLIDKSDVVRDREYSSVFLLNFSDQIFEADLPLE